MKLMKPRELCDLLNEDNGLPEGHRVQISGRLSLFKSRESEKEILRYEGDMQIVSSGNKAYVIEDKKEKFRLRFEQRERATVENTPSLSDDYLVIPVEFNHRGIIIIDKPNNILY